jgi:transposase-like protein
MAISEYLNRYIPMISFSGEIEVDEMFLGARRRGHHGRLPHPSEIIFGKPFFSLWILNNRDLLGIFSRSTKEFLLFHVPDRRSGTLLPYIYEHVHNESTVYSDKSSSYLNARTGTSRLEGLSHLFINHSLHFVDPNIPSIHTNGIEGTWRRLRRFISDTKRALSFDLIDSYIHTFMFINMIDKNQFYKIMLCFLKELRRGQS